MSDDVTTPAPAPHLRWYDQEAHRDLLAIVVMSLTAVLTAWTGFQSAKWNGEMSIAFGQASTARAQAALVSDLTGTAVDTEVALGVAWTDAVAAGETELAATYRSLFPAELEAATVEWESMPEASRPASPLGVESYRADAFGSVSDLLADAEQHFAVALDDNQIGDNYVLTSILAAMVLFFAALSTKLRSARQQKVMLALACVGFVAVVAVVASFPVVV